uniref:Ankyrin repeat domain-containing protein 54 n=1 Tax=Daphnia galeata TaxID=27404 RepID=A0A8J2WD94_9CRUS|nr:unnamed protein product [Daphnia galeata]
MDSRLSYLYDVISQAINENSVSELNSTLNLLTQWMKSYKTKVGIKFLGQCDPKYLLAIQELFSHEIPLPEVIDNIIQDLDYTWWLPLLAEIIKMSRKSISRQGKIVALEFIGASLIMFESGALPLTGLRCWKKAMTLRYSPADGELPIPKIPLRGLLGLSGEVFGSAIEVMSMEEIKEWEHHFMMLHVRFPTLPQTLQIQALLIQHRICSEENPRQTSPSCLYLKSLLTHGNRLFDSGRYDHAINTYLLVLEQMTGFDPKMTHPKAIEDYNLTLGKLSSCFNTLLREPLTSPKREKLTPANIVMAIKFCTTIAKFFPKPKKNYSISWNHSSFVGHIYDFLIILVDVYPQMNSQDKKQLEEHISIYINSNEKDKSTLLHAAIRSYQFNLESINLFLRLGADPNATDMYGKTALHILASKWNWYDTKNELYVQVFQTLVDAGGHLYMATPEGKTVVSILKERRENSSHYSYCHPYLESILTAVPPLTCLCVRVIRQHGIPFNEDYQLPSTLQTLMVSLHSARGLPSPAASPCSKLTASRE